MLSLDSSATQLLTTVQHLMFSSSCGSLDRRISFGGVGLQYLSILFLIDDLFLADTFFTANCCCGELEGDVIKSETGNESTAIAYSKQKKLPLKKFGSYFLMFPTLFSRWAHFTRRGRKFGLAFTYMSISF